jgi:hypothetical protein
MTSCKAMKCSSDRSLRARSSKAGAWVRDGLPHTWSDISLARRRRLKTVVSVLPGENSLPKGFNNLRLYNSGSGEMVKSIRTDGLVGQLMLLPGDTLLASSDRHSRPLLKKDLHQEMEFWCRDSRQPVLRPGPYRQRGSGSILSHRSCLRLRFPAPQIHRGASLRSVRKSRCVGYQDRKPDRILS